ncbi:trichohyalin-like isoform X2 [Paramacrobiotus metropolitanus]|nr:trichohyalin-like isoform X2 [Paramacrobiotus metropolitanus]
MGNLLVVYDTFDRLETARRSIAAQMLEEKHLLEKSKQRFLRTRTDLLRNMTSKMHAACATYSADYEELVKHRHFLEKEILKLEPKIETAERFNQALLGQISYVRNYGPLIAEKLHSEEEQLLLMRQQKAELELKMDTLAVKLEEALRTQDRGRDSMRRKRSLAYDELDTSQRTVIETRDNAAKRRTEILQWEAKRDGLSEKLHKLQISASSLKHLVDQLQSIIAEQKTAAETNLTFLQDELVRYEEKREREDQEELAALLASGASETSLPAHLAKKYLTKEQRLERLRKRKVRRQRKEKQLEEKQQKQTKTLEKNTAKMRAIIREASERIAEMQQERLSLDPLVDRLNVLEETFQNEILEKEEMRMSLHGEMQRKTEELHEAQQKLEALQSSFKAKLDNKRRELNVVRAKRIHQEKLIKELTKKDAKQRKRLTSQLEKAQSELEIAVEKNQIAKRKHETIQQQNADTEAELNELNLAIKTAYNLIPGDEAQRRALEEELNIKISTYTHDLHRRYELIQDKADLCAQFTREIAAMRQDYHQTVAELRRWVCVEIADEKMRFYKAFSGYRLLMWHYRRFMAVREYLVRSANEARRAEQERVKEFWQEARQERTSLAATVKENFRVARRFYHLNVAYHILHIENIRGYFRNYAADDNYQSAVEIASADKLYNVNINAELAQRQKYWTWTLSTYYSHFMQYLQNIVDTQEHTLQSSDRIWEKMNSDVVQRQNITVDESVKRLLNDDFRAGWSWLHSPPEAGDGCRWSNED